ncbi:MAG: hypothetical protein K9H62_13995 [Bacteroidales bacterium]|nr:hypothetical protein [Bacteroidales bacterium]
MKYLLTFLIIQVLSLNTFEINAQLISNQKTTREIIITQNKKILKFSILVNKYKGKHQENLYYYWYNDKLVKSNLGGSSGFLLHGKYEVFDQNKNLLSQGFFDEGLKNGTWKFWDSDGELIKLEDWKHGLQQVKEAEKIKEKPNRKKGQFKEKFNAKWNKIRSSLKKKEKEEEDKETKD